MPVDSGSLGDPDSFCQSRRLAAASRPVSGLSDGNVPGKQWDRRPGRDFAFVSHGKYFGGTLDFGVDHDLKVDRFMVGSTPLMQGSYPLSILQNSFSPAGVSFTASGTSTLHVAIPEPSPGVLLAGALALGVFYYRPRR